MADINSLHISGYLGKDPEFKAFESGHHLINFSVASEYWQGSEKGAKTNWFKCRAWGKNADYIAEYAKKSSAVFIEGSMQFEKYKDKDGVERTASYVLVDKIQINSRKD